MASSSAQPWQPLTLLVSQFRMNVAALAPRYPHLAQQLLALPATTWVLSTAAGQLRLAERIGETIREIADPAPPPKARGLVAKVFPSRQCTFPLVVAGIGFGWLWEQLYALPISTPLLPGYRPPLYFMARDVAQLHAVLHLHNWSAMLADDRVQLFIGPDGYEQLERALRNDNRSPWPKLAVTVEPACWPVGRNLDGLVQSLFAEGGKRLAELTRRAAAFDPTLAARIERGGPLRILGVTSRYTTFLQHSMRDWLDAFARMGHETKLLIEDADHQVMNNLEHAQVSAAFGPDLIVLIDHYRGAFAGLPKHVPCVMWVQDAMPAIFSDEAGAAQTELDFCLGSGRLLLTRRHGYPADRFMSAPVTVNEVRFAPRELSAGELDRYACDVAFVSHASTPADVLLREQLDSATHPGIRKLLTDIFERLCAIYDAGGCVSHPLRIAKLIAQSAAALGVGVDAKQMPVLVGLFTHRINNALFRHQALRWLIDLGVDVRLYGRGWESHPHLSRFARGPADNHGELCTIYQASRINLQVTPHGPLHQRLFEGVAAGAFFLLRAQPVDEVDALYRPLFAWCEANGICDDADLHRRATPEVRALLDQFQRMTGLDPLALEFPLTDEIRLAAESGFALAAAGAIPEYEAVAFDSPRELRDKVRRYLADPAERNRVAAAVRQRVLERYTYSAVSKQLLSLIGRSLSAKAAPHVPVAA